MKKFLLLTLVVMFAAFRANAQVTTSSLTGTVRDSQETLIGATIKATHLPTGTTYGSSTGADGRFNIPNMRVGGPYTVSISYIGYQNQTFSDIALKLGEPYVLNVLMTGDGRQLQEVVVTATNPFSVLNADRSGAVTSISRAQIQTLPTITRSVNDITRLTPQAGGPNGSIGGGSYRSNNFTVDGANFNNQFGIGQNIPAGGSPISLDALDQISINVTPYDVRQSGFTGASVNAVTRSGTNDFFGTGFYSFRGDNHQGGKVAGTSINKQPYRQDQYGVSLGGPIVKNKLFFFVNLEKNNITQPGPAKVAATPAMPYSAANPNVARPTADFLNGVRSHLISTYNYDPGIYQGYSNLSNNDKFLARVDWNISDKHRFNIRYNQVESKSPRSMSSSVTNAGYTYPNSRTSNFALHFANSNYYEDNNLYSLSAELNSTFGKLTNSLRGSRTKQNDPRSSDSQVFPFVDILEGGSPITSFGYEPFTYGNVRDVENYTFNNDLTGSFGKHLLTFGLQAEFSTTKNGFQRWGTSHYTFASWNDFVNNARPSNFLITYPLSADGSQVFPSFKFAQYSAYLQDEFTITDKFKLTLGARFEKATYPAADEIRTHPLVSGLTFANGRKVDTGVLPESVITFSPRLGFNWDVNGDRSVQLRGGTGVFVGRIPNVWAVAQSGDSGLLQVSQVFNGQANVPGVFNPNINAYVPTTKPPAGTTIPSAGISVLSPDLKNPRVWKSSLAVDTKLPFGVVGSLEGIYGRDLQSAYAYNANLTDPTPLTVTGYPDNRPVFAQAANAKFINKLNASGLPAASGSGFNTIVMDNVKGGHYWSVTAQLNKQFSRNLGVNVSYTKSGARNYGDLGGDQILNLWSYPYTTTNSNTPSLGFTSNVIPDRVIASLNFRKEYLKNLATSISLFYEGGVQGRYSYYYSSDFNRDGQVNDLIYVPKDASEITFEPIPAGTSGYAKAYSAQEQSDIFFAFIEQDDYLRTRKGKYTERNGASTPWRNQVDLRLTQEIFKNLKTKNSFEFNVDIFNVGNLINSNWGNVNFVNNMGILIPRNAANMGGSTRPTFRLNSNSGDIVRNSFGTTQTISSTYYAQFGFRYRFN
jgi:outer membrane receptor protein involved in Fe transport